MKQKINPAQPTIRNAHPALKLVPATYVARSLTEGVQTKSLRTTALDLVFADDSVFGSEEHKFNAKRVVMSALERCEGDLKFQPRIMKILETACSISDLILRINALLAPSQHRPSDKTRRKGNGDNRTKSTWRRGELYFLRKVIAL